MTSMKKMYDFELALIDADPLLYAIGFACQHERFYLTSKQGGVVFDYRIRMKNHPRRFEVLNQDGEKLYAGENKQECHDYVDGICPDCERDSYIHLDPIQNAIHSLKMMINGIHKASGAKAYRLYLSGKQNFRIKRATLVKYKVSREKLEKPEYYQALRDWMIKEGAIVRDFYEADDLVSMMLWKFKGRVILCTIDKDLMMVPGDHYNWQKHTKEFNGRVHVTPIMGALNLFKQLITGDKVDDIPGLSGTRENPGPGPKTAEKWLLQCSTTREMWDLTRYKYVKTFATGEHHLYNKDCGLDPDEAMQENLELLWMLKSTNDVGNITLEKLESYYGL